MTKHFSLEVGDSFKIVNEYGAHLHFIIAEESDKDHSSIILVYLSSSDTVYKDRTTILKYGEHPYISNRDKESWIRYQNTILCSRDDVFPLITTHYGKISPELLARIQNGFVSSSKVDKTKKIAYEEWKTDKLYASLK